MRHARRPVLALLTFAVLFVAPAGVVMASRTRVTAVPMCTTGQLALSYVNATGAAGSVARQYGLRNRSARRCRLSGYPKLQLLGATGRPLRTIEGHAAPGAFGITPRVMTVRPGAMAYFAVRYASATGYGGLACPIASALRVTPPGATVALVLRGPGARVRAYGGTTEHLRCGMLTVSAVTAHRFQ